MLVSALAVTTVLFFGTGLALATRRSLGVHASLLQQSAPAPFLRPPFYGTAGMNSIFDHEYPIYDDEAGFGGATTDIVHFDGRRLAGPAIVGMKVLTTD
jgi:hypothetical protein